MLKSAANPSTHFGACLVICALLCSCSKPAATDSGQVPNETSGGRASDLIGTWKVMPSGGESADKVRGMTYVFTKSDMTIQLDGRVIMSATYEVAENQRPSELILRTQTGVKKATVVKPFTILGNRLTIGRGDNREVLRRVEK